MIFLKRMTLVLFLIGSAGLFTYWSNGQFNQIIDDLSDLSELQAATATNISNHLSRQRLESDSTSPETLEELSASIDESTPGIVAGTTTPAISTSSDNIDFSFTFPKEGDKVYIGCTYPISWETPTTTDLLGVNLIDAGTRETIGSIASGLAIENIIESDSQNLTWKVGGVWSGSYYMKVSNINGVETEARSEVFEINKMSENISASEREIICKGSGGLS